MKKTELVDFNTITPEELNNLQSLVSDFNSIKLKCGDLEIQKHELLHKLASISQSLEAVQTQLKEIYGDVIIDINTGLFKHKDDGTNT